MSMTNLQLWNYIRKMNPNFRSHTAEGTKDLFTTKGFEALQLEDVGAINDFFLLSVRVAFQKLNVATAKNPLSDVGLVEVYDNPYGGYIQRMQIDSFKPTSPQYKNLVNGQSVDMQKVRKGTAKERFFTQNFDFASFYSLQDFAVKQIFISEYGMSDFISGFIKALQNGYTVQEYVNILNCLSAGLNSSDYPLKDSQVVTLESWTDGAPTDAQLVSFILALKDLATIMDTSASTTAFSATSFDTAYDKDDFVLLMRAGIKNRISTALMVGAFNPEQLSIPFEIKEVEHFGGLTPYVTIDGVKTTLYDVYDSNGAHTGFSTTEEASTATYLDGDSRVEWYDPNRDRLAVLIQKGTIFEAHQNGLQVLPAPYNVAGLYQNWHMTRPNSTIVFDPLYGVISINQPTRVEVTAVTIDKSAPTVGDTITATVTPATATNVSYQWYSGDSSSAITTKIDDATGSTFEVGEDLVGKYLKVIVSGDFDSTASVATTSAVASAEATAAKATRKKQ